jgi:hypothetical protein
VCTAECVGTYYGVTVVKYSLFIPNIPITPSLYTRAASKNHFTAIHVALEVQILVSETMTAMFSVAPVIK